MNMTRHFDLDSDDMNIHETESTEVSRSKSINQLMTCVNSVSRSLAELGLAKGETVLILMANSFEMIEALLATINLGAIAVPLNPQTGTTTIEYAIRSTRPKACIFSTPLKAEYLAALSACGCTILVATACDFQSEGRVCHDYATLAASHGGRRIFHEHEDSDTALILYTSGSSGVPKAIRRSHRVMIGFLEYFIRYYGTDNVPASQRSAHILTLPMSHMGGLLVCLNALLAQRPLYVMSYFHPATYLRLVAKHRLDSLILIPTMYSLLLKDDPQLAGLNLENVKYCYIGAEACPEVLLERIRDKFNALTLSTYGTTECLAGIGYTAAARQSGDVVKGSCGQHVYGEIRLVDGEGNSGVELGELWVRNETVEECYLAPALNTSRFVEGWYRTGDIFYRDSRGHFFWKGRVDDMFICKGNNIYPLEIENILLNSSRVEAACAAPLEDANGNTLVGLLAIVKDGVSEAELLRYLLDHAPAHAVPQFVVLAETIPVVGVGKADRPAVSALLQKRYTETRGLRPRVTEPC